jgi:DNA repair photolyase
MRLEVVAARSILTPTGGFLSGFTHSLNPYRGCAFGNAACGVYCYAAETRYGKDRALPWGSYLLPKAEVAALYREEAARVRGRGGALRLFMSTVTDPYVPQEKRLGLTRALLAAMVDCPPDLLVLQTHTPGPLRDLDLLVALQQARRYDTAAPGRTLAGGAEPSPGSALKPTRVVVQVTVETDLARLPGLPPHATPIAARLAALQQIRKAGLPTVAAVSPLLPLGDPVRFADALGERADGVILDHWLLGDGSRNGARTLRRRAHAPLTLPEALEAAGLGEWNGLERFREVVALFRARLGEHRIGVSEEGFRRACVDERWPR